MNMQIKYAFYKKNLIFMQIIFAFGSLRGRKFQIMHDNAFSRN